MPGTESLGEGRKAFVRTTCDLKHGHPVGEISGSFFASLLALLVQRPAVQDGSAS